MTSDSDSEFKDHWTSIQDITPELVAGNDQAMAAARDAINLMLNAAGLHFRTNGCQPPCHGDPMIDFVSSLDCDQAKFLLMQVVGDMAYAATTGTSPVASVGPGGSSGYPPLTT